MDPSVYDEWNTIENVKISRNGQWVAYEIVPGKGDGTLVLYNTRTSEDIRIARGTDPRFDYNNYFLAFTIKAHEDSIRALKLKEVDEDDLPKDSLGIMDLLNERLEKIPYVRSFKMPEKAGGVIAWQHHENAFPEDSSAVKKAGEDNGYTMRVRSFPGGKTEQMEFVKWFEWAEKEEVLLVHTTGRDSSHTDEIWVLDGPDWNRKMIFSGKGDYPKLSINNKGNMASFILDRDTTKGADPAMELFFWKAGSEEATMIADTHSVIIPSDWQLSPHKDLRFTDNNSRLIFGIEAIPPAGDTTLLEEEKPVVEVWDYREGYLFTQNKKRLEEKSINSYKVVYNVHKKSFVQLEAEDREYSHLPDDLKGNYTFSYTEIPYLQFISWIGYAFKDLYLTDIRTGEDSLIANRIQGHPRLSPAENYIYWYSRPDTSWYAFDIADDTLRRLTRNAFYDELNDRPMHPRGEGHMGWLRNDLYFLVYDRFDIWLIDPKGEDRPQKVTPGRENNFRYRYIELDEDTESFPADTTLLLSYFDVKDKSSGYVYLNLGTFEVTPLLGGSYKYSSDVIKAQNSRQLVYTKSSFSTFPDLILSSTEFLGYRVISDANPQQSLYAWGTIELYNWVDSSGKEREGLLVKPPDFDPNQKYPMIINFYERSSQGLHEHRAPFPHRSTINYSYYANRGYVIFNPDVEYRIGYPGASALEAVTSGAQALINEGFIDPDRIGLQGHSWGGYQVAHIITKTDMFRCAEAGAPVVNMISAYGGIRWRSGRSRMFQYERTQSRLGASLWENPELYLENSPIFNIDKVNTPVLILHNDQDGAVPWYQGIEFFVALRRLGKPAWFLNYNNEPHWPVKRPNRIDFNVKMQEFFDHYLMDKPVPLWMKVN